MKKALVVAMMLVMALVFASAAQAVVVTASIEQAGVNNVGFYYVFLTDKSVPANWAGSQGFLIADPIHNVGFPAAVTNAMYASALTAVAGSKTVVVDLTAFTPFSLIFALHGTASLTRRSGPGTMIRMVAINKR